MKNKFKTIKWLDYLMFGIVIAKILIFYFVTDMTGIRMMSAFLTLAFIILLSGSFLLSGNKASVWFFAIIYSVISILMFVDSMYFSYFNQLPSIVQLMQVNAMIIVDADTFSVALPPINSLLIVDIPFAIWYFSKLNQRVKIRRLASYKRVTKILTIGLTLVILLGILNPLNADAIKIMNKSELVTYHLRDIYEQAIAGDSSYIESQADLNALLNELDRRDESVSPEYKSLKGALEGRHLIIVQMESMENFVIGKSYKGQVLTPNLNRLIDDNSLYFNQYYETIGRGNTSDAELASNNSIYPVIEGESYKLYVDNTFNGLPWLLKSQGYKSKVYHGYKGDFWNREEAYVEQGFDDFISLEDLKMDEKIAFGLSDRSMYKQAVEMMEEDYQRDKKPMHNMLISLSCHFPYRMPEEYQVIKDEEDDNYDSLFANYLSGVRYADDAIGSFLDDLKKTSFYDNSVIVFYGDHYGLNCNDADNYQRMCDFLGKDYDYDEMLNIPLIIHIPGLDDIYNGHRRIAKTSGQVDLLPTLSYLMGFETDEIVFGQNIFSNEPAFVASVTYMLKGSFIKDNIIYEASSTEVFEEGRAWNIHTGQKYENFDFLFEDFIKANRLVEGSKYILDENLIKR